MVARKKSVEAPSDHAGNVQGEVFPRNAHDPSKAVANLYVPALSQVLVFVLMAVVLLWRPAGLFGREERVA